MKQTPKYDAYKRRQRRTFVLTAIIFVLYSAAVAHFLIIAGLSS